MAQSTRPKAKSELGNEGGAKRCRRCCSGGKGNRSVRINGVRPRHGASLSNLPPVREGEGPL